jgi:hypothetical protein
MIRTPKEWDESCRECGGSGHVHRQERFVLWTPEEGAAAGLGKKFFHIDAKYDVPRDAYVCVAQAGASIFEACEEAIDIARIARRPVAFEFSGAVAVCFGTSDPEKVAKAWWNRAYGKSYEQSMKDR